MFRLPVLPTVAWLMTCLAVLFAGLALRPAPVELTVAWPTTAPWAAAAAVAPKLALVLAALAVPLLAVTVGRLRGGPSARPFAELLLYPLLVAFVWFLLPAGRPELREIIVGAALLAVVVYLAACSPRFEQPAHWRWTRATLLVDAGVVLLPVAVGLALGHRPDLKAGVWSLLGYPAYALVQLVLFMMIPVTRLRALGLPPAATTGAAAVLFALVHWPNPLVMAVTFAGMLIWARQYQAGRRLWQIALVMGLVATTFSQGLPDGLTRHVRVGPSYVRSLAVPQVAEITVGVRDPEPAAYLQRAYPVTIGRPIAAEELATWEKLIARARRSTWAYMFLISDEYRRKLPQQGGETVPDPVMHWNRWPVAWRQRIADLASEDYLAAAGGTNDRYLEALYRDLLGRAPSDREYGGWSRRLSLPQRRRLAEVLLNLHDRQGQATFTGLDIEAFEFPN